MIRRLPPSLMGTCFFAGAALVVAAQAPVPPVPLSQEQRQAAAAIEAPQTFTPPPLPGQVRPGTPPPTQPQLPPAAPSVPAAPAPALTPAGTSASSASTMSALEAPTQEPLVQEAPRVSSPAARLPITSSTSTSRQFIVHGKVFETRSAMSSRCEEISQELRKVLNDKEPWVLPVIVLLNTGADATKSQGPAITTAITEITHGGFHLQVTVNERPGLNAAELREGIVRALLAERIVRNHQKITTPKGRLVLPDWVMTGVLHAMDYKASARPSAIFSTIFRSGKIYGIEEIIAASPVEMDGLSRTIYETSCCALVLALVDQPSGPQNFNKFLNALASDPRSERELLDLAFPKFASSASSLNKWWSLQLAMLSKPGIAERFNAADSLKAVEDAIQIRYAAKPEEVPQNVKPRPFVLPAPLVMTFPPKPRPSAPSPSPSSAGEEGPDPRRTQASKPREMAAQQPGEGTPEITETPETTDATDDKPKRALWRRMLFLGAAKPDDAPPEEAPPATEEEKAESKPGFIGRLLGAGGGEKEEKKPKEEPSVEPERAMTAAAEKPQAPAEEPKAESKPGFIGRLLGAGGGEKDEKKPKEEPAAGPDKTVTAAAEKPKATAAKETEKPKAPAKQEPAKEKKEESRPVEEEKPSKLNPLNWFKGGKKSAEETGEREPAKDGQASLDMARLLSPALADAWQMLAPAAPQQTVDMLKFLRRKKAEEEAPAPAPAPASKPEPKPKPAASKPRRTSNPNSKPASQPKPSTPDAPRTNNPNAKPVPAAAMAAAAGVTTAGAAPASPATGLVAVTLPLEEYKLIMKRPDREEILDRNMADLRALDLRVSPLFRPVVLAYLAAFNDLKENKTKDMDKRIVTLREFALLAYQKSIAVRDYLDYYEANESGSLTGKFDDYLNLPSIIQKELPPRTDPISKYLDAIDKEFTK
ncbi:MAG: hypothetical protein ACO1TE_01475 [Prosthecobacter sp.]